MVETGVLGREVSSGLVWVRGYVPDFSPYECVTEVTQNRFFSGSQFKGIQPSTVEKTW